MVEYLAFFPLLLALSLVFFNGFVAVTAKTSAEDAARAAARAHSQGDSAWNAAMDSLPGWLDEHLEDLDISVDGDLVTATVDLSVPAAGGLFVREGMTSEATFEED